MAKEEAIELEGIVTDAQRGSLFKVQFENGHEALCHPSGRMQTNHIKILPGDTVTVEVSPYDLTKGRITYRSK